MKVTLRGKEYIVTFRETEIDSDYYTTITVCDIYSSGPMIGGFALCVWTDLFSEREGRKKALTRALKKFSRKDREVFWKAYFAEVTRR